MTSGSERQEEPPRVKVVIKSHACASELYVVNRAYAMVAKGVGYLDLELEPGRYKVRQRIGYSEQVHELEVAEDQAPLAMMLPALAFPSPIPLMGSQWPPMIEGPRPFSHGAGNVRIVLRQPVGPGELLTDSQQAQTLTEMRRLRLERFDGTLLQPFEGRAVQKETPGFEVFSTHQPPGTYLLVQAQEDGRQVCMPLPVREARTTMVFCLTLRDEGDPIPVELGHAAVAMLRDQDLAGGYEASLLRMEAARKALGAGRHMHGWSFVASVASHPAEESPENVLLDLMDMHLGWLSLNASSAERAAMFSRLKGASAVLGQDSADIAALVQAMAVSHTPIGVPAFDAPPLLKRSWDRLLSSKDGNARAGKVMPFPFQVESGATWFVWSEQPGARAEAFAKAAQADVPSVRSPRGDRITLPEFDRAGGVMKELEPSVPMRSFPVTELLLGGLQVLREAVVERIPWFGRREVPVVTFEDVEQMLAALLEDESFQVWLSKAQRVAEEQGLSIKDESMRQLVSSLRSLSDPILLKALGAETVAKQVLAALRLPRERVMQLVKDLLSGVVMRLEQKDREAILAVLQGAVGVAKVWLKAPDTPSRNP